MRSVEIVDHILSSGSGRGHISFFDLRANDYISVQQGPLQLQKPTCPGLDDYDSLDNFDSFDDYDSLDDLDSFDDYDSFLMTIMALMITTVMTVQSVRAMTLMKLRVMTLMTPTVTLGSIWQA